MKRILLLAALAFVGGCAFSENPALSAEAEAQIAEEVRATFRSMSDAILALDLEGALALFDQDAVHAADGRMFIGMDEIGPAYREGMGVVAEFNRVDVTRERLEVLGPDAASYAIAFDESFRTAAGDTAEISGVWTMVFHRTPDGWRIVHSAASHAQ